MKMSDLVVFPERAVLGADPRRACKSNIIAAEQQNQNSKDHIEESGMEQMLYFIEIPHFTQNVLAMVLASDSSIGILFDACQIEPLVNHFPRRKFVQWNADAPNLPTMPLDACQRC